MFTYIELSGTGRKANKTRRRRWISDKKNAPEFYPEGGKVFNLKDFYHTVGCVAPVTYTPLLGAAFTRFQHET